MQVRYRAAPRPDQRPPRGTAARRNPKPVRGMSKQETARSRLALEDAPLERRFLELGDQLRQLVLHFGERDLAGRVLEAQFERSAGRVLLLVERLLRARDGEAPGVEEI